MLGVPVGGSSAIISISFTSVFGSGTRLKKVDSGMTALLECSIPRAGVFPALGWVDHFKDQIRRINDHQIIKEIENELSFSFSGEHWDRATVLDHGEQLGQAAEGNPHRGHPGLTSCRQFFFFFFLSFYLFRFMLSVLRSSWWKRGWNLWMSSGLQT